MVRVVPSLFGEVIVLGLVALALFGIFIAVDSWFLPKKQATGCIVDRRYHPPHTTTHLQTVGKVTIPITTHHGPSWELVIRLDDGRMDSIGVSEECYDAAVIGGRATVEHVDGRITGGLYIKALFT